MSSAISLPKNSKGKRPSFFEDEAVDHLLAMVLEVSTEISVIYSKVNRIEKFLARTSVLNLEGLEKFELSPEEVAEVDAWASLFIERLYSSVRKVDLKVE